jgi:hypothetical protein
MLVPHGYIPILIVAFQKTNEGRVSALHSISFPTTGQPNKFFLKSSILVH